MGWTSTTGACPRQRPRSLYDSRHHHAERPRHGPADRRQFFFALLSLTRCALDLGFVSRPLLAALLWGGLTWTLQPALSVGVFFELLWLDLFPAGTYIPPQGLLSLTACLSLLSCLPGADMRTTALVLIVTLPLAYLGAWIEQTYRTRQNLSYNQLITWNRRGFGHAYTPEHLVFRAMAELFVLYFLLHLVCVLALLPVLRLVQPWLIHGPQPTWALFWFAASIGAILALRLPRVYALAGAALIVGAAATL